MNTCPCPEKGQLHAYLLGSLAAPQSDVIDEHLDQCPECRVAVDELDTTVNEVFACLRRPAPHSSLQVDPAFQYLVNRVKGIGGRAAPGNGSDGPRPGQVLGNYELLESLGAGGMGQVFKAQHRRMKRLVALKVLAPEWIRSSAARERFQREVEAIARLSSPHVVAAFDAGECQDRDFLVMEYVQGCNLAELVKKEGPLPVDRALDYILQAARGLADAHAAGIIHRDVKPANLLLSEGRVKVLDLGLARVFAADRKADLSAARAIMGTAAFMAPEQGVNSHQADERADIYSLGCCLFYLLTGKPPFEAGTDLEILQAHRDQPIPSLRSERPDCPPAVDALFRSLVAKRPDERPASMRALIAELERLHPVGSAHTAGSRRGWLLAGAVALAAGFLLAVLLPHLIGRRDDSPDSGDTSLASRLTTPGKDNPNPGPDGRPMRGKAPGQTTRPKVPAAREKVLPAPVIKMVTIPAGEFWMGSPDSDKNAQGDEKPRRRIKITVPFRLARTKITQAEYEQVMGTNPSAFRTGGRYKRLVGDKDTRHHPVESISWMDAVRFCNRLSKRHGLKPYYRISDKAVTVVPNSTGYRLPTEAEWEYACRGATDTRWYFGDSPGRLGENAWYADNSGGMTHPVGEKKSNPFGLFDMHGNVPEWCWDRYDPRYYGKGPLSDPPGPGRGKTRVYRGGGWNDAVAQTRAAARRSLPTGYGVLTIVGMRVAQNIPD